MAGKRPGILIMCMALIVPILMACGGRTTETVAPTPAAPAETPLPPTAVPGETRPRAGVGIMPEGASAGMSGDITRLQVEDGATIRFVAPANITEQQLYLQGIGRFNQIFPNVTVNFEPITEQYLTRMIAEFTAGTAPDVLLVDGEVMGNIGLNNLLLPLDEAMQTAGVQTDEYVDVLIELYQHQDQTFAIPKDFNPLVLFINTEMAQEANVDPTTIRTWQDMQNAAQALTVGEGVGRTYGMCLNPDILRYGASMFQNGNPIVENNQAVFNQPNAVEAIEMWYSFRQNGTGELFAALGRTWCGEAFAGRSTAMVVEGGWLMPFLADPAQGATDLQYTAVPLPIPEGGEQATWLFTNGIGASATTQFPNAAAALVLFLTGEANQRAQIPTGLAQPSLIGLADDPYYEQNEIARVLVEQGQYGRLADMVLGGPQNKGDVISAINQTAMEPIFLGAQTPQQALDAAAQEVNRILQQ